MAVYKYSQFLVQSTNEAFDKLFHPGTNTVYSGIYRCEVCGKEIASVVNYPLPPQNHHQHNAGLGPIVWRLAVGHQ
jgi:hypothetical protein